MGALPFFILCSSPPPPCTLITLVRRFFASALLSVQIRECAQFEWLSEWMYIRNGEDWTDAHWMPIIVYRTSLSTSLIQWRSTSTRCRRLSADSSLLSTSSVTSPQFFDTLRQRQFSPSPVHRSLAIELGLARCLPLAKASGLCLPDLPLPLQAPPTILDASDLRAMGHPTLRVCSSISSSTTFHNHTSRARRGVVHNDVSSFATESQERAHTSPRSL
jgi:hypothetical protein